jgi:O-acetyl-ADP-ribose deacetylase (regulator of RNase III)
MERIQSCVQRGAARRVSPHTFCAAWRAAALRVELWVTPCIVTSPPSDECDALIVPANERLQGTQFTPSECSRRLAQGTTLVYPPQCIDGLVTELGGAELAAACASLPSDELNIRCPTGGAAVTSACGELRACYQHLVHACAPFYHGETTPSPPTSARWRRLLRSCYHAAFDAADSVGARHLAVPLLGSGARGAPVAASASVAAEAVSSWRGEVRGGASSGKALLRVARFAVQHDDAAWAIQDALDLALCRVPGSRLTDRAVP